MVLPSIFIGHLIGDWFDRVSFFSPCPMYPSVRFTAQSKEGERESVIERQREQTSKWTDQSGAARTACRRPLGERGGRPAATATGIARRRQCDTEAHSRALRRCTSHQGRQRASWGGGRGRGLTAPVSRGGAMRGRRRRGRRITSPRHQAEPPSSPPARKRPHARARSSSIGT